MSAKSILEADGKAILNYHLTRAPVIKPTPLAAPTTHNAPPKLASLHFPEDAAVSDVLDQAEVTYPWLLAPGAKFVAKPDQLIKRRGKSGLLALNKPWSEAKAWIAERARKEQKVEHTTGLLTQFLVEPFVPHPQDTEYYINIHSVRDVSSNFFAFFSWTKATSCCPTSGDPGTPRRISGQGRERRETTKGKREGRMVLLKHRELIYRRSDSIVGSGVIGYCQPKPERTNGCNLGAISIHRYPLAGGFTHTLSSAITLSCPLPCLFSSRSSNSHLKLNANHCHLS